MKKENKQCILWIVIGVLWILAVGIIAFVISILK